MSQAQRDKVQFEISRATKQRAKSDQARMRVERCAAEDLRLSDENFSQIEAILIAEPLKRVTWQNYNKTLINRLRSSGYVVREDSFYTYSTSEPRVKYIEVSVPD